MNERLYDNGYDPPYQGGQGPGNRPVPGPAVPGKRTGHVWLTVLGGIAGLVGFLLLYTPILLKYQGGTLSDVHSLCNSGIGILGRALDSTANNECGSIGSWYSTGMVLLWGGVVTAVSGAIWWIARTSRRPA